MTWVLDDLGTVVPGGAGLCASSHSSILTVIMLSLPRADEDAAADHRAARPGQVPLRVVMLNIDPWPFPSSSPSGRATFRTRLTWYLAAFTAAGDDSHARLCVPRGHPVQAAALARHEANKQQDDLDHVLHVLCQRLDLFRQIEPNFSDSPGICTWPATSASCVYHRAAWRCSALWAAYDSRS